MLKKQMETVVARAARVGALADRLDVQLEAWLVGDSSRSFSPSCDCRQRPLSELHLAFLAAVPVPSLPAALSPIDRPGPVLQPFAAAHCGGERLQLWWLALSFGGSLSRSRGSLRSPLLRHQRAALRPPHRLRGRVSEAILWMRSGNAQDVAARR